MISSGASEDVVFMDHVKRNERGFTSSTPPPAPPPTEPGLLGVVVDWGCTDEVVMCGCC